jgi:hypothetical protein
MGVLIVKKIFYNMKKYFYCRFFHRDFLCYPEVGGRGLKGPWHCSQCHPCSEGLEILFKEIPNE